MRTHWFLNVKETVPFTYAGSGRSPKNAPREDPSAQLPGENEVDVFASGLQVAQAR